MSDRNARDVAIAREGRPPESALQGSFWWLEPIDDDEGASPWMWNGTEYEGMGGGIVPERHGKRWRLAGPCIAPQETGGRDG